MKKRFVAIGHITNDTEPIDHLGGVVSYSTVVASQLGYEAHVITKCPPYHPYIKELQDRGITVHVLPSKRNTITTFEIIYHSANKRTMRVLEQQEPITKTDLAALPKNILKDATFLIATVLGEVDTGAFPFLANFGSVSLVPQGYFREITSDKKVLQHPWIGPQKDMQTLSSIIFSQEDITMQREINQTLLHQFRQLVPITVMTQGDRGSTIYTNEQTFSIPAVPLKPEELNDLTGAGDTYTAAFLTSYQEKHDLKQAAKFATIFTALKIIAKGGLGMDSIPEKEDYETFLAKNNNRINPIISLLSPIG